MKRRLSILSLVLAFVMCLGVAMPAWAEEKNNLTSDVIDIMNAVEFEEMQVKSMEQVAENDGVQKFTVDIADATLDVYADNVKVSQQMIEEYFNRASYAIAQETVATLNSDREISDDVIQYIYTDGINEVRYIEGFDDNNEHVRDMIITKAEQPDQANAGIVLQASDTIPSGIGIRGKVKQDGQYITGSFVDCKPENYDSRFSCYQYFGFMTTVGSTNANYANADMGVVYSDVRGGWRPYLLLTQGAGSAKKTYMISTESNQSDVIAVGHKVWELGESGYKTNAPVYITVYKNISKYDGSSGTAVRLSVRGTSAADGRTNVLCLAEAGTGVNISVNYRVLTTITDYDNGLKGDQNVHIEVPAASNASAPRLKMNYSGLNVAGTAVTWTGTEPDSSKVTSATTGTIVGQVNNK